MSLQRTIVDKTLIKPDLWTMKIVSSIECAVLCFLVPQCSTVNLVPLVNGKKCQLSRERSICMEKEEAYTNPGSSIYEKKVCIIYYYNFWELSKHI